MKTKIIFSIALISALVFAGYSCNKENKMMGNNKMSELTLTAQQTTISARGTTTITASISNIKQCCNMKYYWTATAGTLSENGTEATYTAPENTTQCTITCTAKDGCGMISQSKSIVITVR